MIITPKWSSHARVKSLSTTRLFSNLNPGYSQPPYNAFNLGEHVGDQAQDVVANRKLLARALAERSGVIAERSGTDENLKPIAWLEQVHGAEVVERNEQNAHQILTADAQFTRESMLPLAIMTADCLPVLIADTEGSKVAAVHCGWRPLAQGILAKTAATFCKKSTLVAWFGPCISQACFEVGAEVRDIFLTQAQVFEQCFVDGDEQGKYLADLKAIAKLQLQLLGVDNISQSTDCTFTKAEQFFSYRRANITGRMATVIWRL